MELNLSFEEQLSQLAVRGLTHGLRLHAHLVLVRGELVCAGFLVPQVEEAARRRANHPQLAVKVLPVQVHVLQAPAFDAAVKTTCRRKRRWNDCGERWESGDAHVLFIVSLT